MSASIVRLGSPRVSGEGLRLGTVRRPPRGVPKGDYARRNYFDVWLPALSPSLALLGRAKGAAGADEWARFVRSFRAEMNAPDASRLLDLLAALSNTADFSVGCYCEDERRCHRSVLRDLLLERGARVR